MRISLVRLVTALVLPAALFACGEELTDESIDEALVPDTAVVEFRNAPELASEISIDGPIIATCGPDEPVCEKGFVRLSKLFGNSVFCDACVPIPTPGTAPECFFDSQCGAGESCVVDFSTCNLPSYCGCFTGCGPTGNVCGICIDCACGGTCEPTDF